MSNPKNIHSFAELEDRKRELELEVEVSKRELAHSLGTSKVNLNDFLLKKVALPVGGAIAGLYLISKFKGRKRHTHEYHEKTVIKEVPATDDVAKYHYPVPPPEDDNDTEYSNRYVAQQAKYRRSGTDVNATKKEDPSLTKKDKKGILNMATIVSVAKIVAPAIKMIISSVKDHKNQILETEKDGVPKV